MFIRKRSQYEFLLRMQTAFLVHFVALSIPFVFVNCASVSALFQIQYLEFYSTYKSALSL